MQVAYHTLAVYWFGRALVLHESCVVEWLVERRGTSAMPTPRTHERLDVRTWMRALARR